MAKDMNQLSLIGRLTKNPVLKYSNGGVAYVNISLAVKHNSSNNKESNQVSFFELVIFGKYAESVYQYLKKGLRIGVNGYIKQSRWNNDQGKLRSMVKIVVENLFFLPEKKYLNNNSLEDKNNNENYNDENNNNEVPF